MGNGDTTRKMRKRAGRAKKKARVARQTKALKDARKLHKAHGEGPTPQLVHVVHNGPRVKNPHSGHVAFQQKSGMFTTAPKGNWTCPNCQSAKCYAKETKCYHCGATRPDLRKQPGRTRA